MKRVVAPIGLLTDFGTRAGYVAALKGVILSGCGGQCTIIDLSHAITHQDVVEAAFFLENCNLYFPDGFVFVVVVDPGVGSKRRIVALQTEKKGQFFVAPDNGVLDKIAEEQGVKKAVILNKKEHWRDVVSHTFHGRDIMGPVAAKIAMGVPLENLGTSVDPATLVRLELPRPTVDVAAKRIAGDILYWDDFGNVVTNFSEDDFNEFNVHIDKELEITVVQEGGSTSHVSMRFVTHYNAVPPGDMACLFNSENKFEIAVNGGSAAAALQLKEDAKKPRVFITLEK